MDGDEAVGDGVGVVAASGLPARMAVISEQVGGMLEEDPWHLSDSELEGLIEGLHELGSRLTAVRGQVLVDAFNRGFAVRQGAADLPSWLRERLTLAPLDARRQVAVARDLDDPCRATGQALAAGDIGAEQARVICEAMRALPGGISPEQRAAAERALLDHARSLDPHQLVRLAARLREHLTTVDTSSGGDDPQAGGSEAGGSGGDPAGGPASNAAGGASGAEGPDGGPNGDSAAEGDHAGEGEDGDAGGSRGGRWPGPADERMRDPASMRRFSLTDTPWGTTLIHGELDAEGAALLRTALDGLAAPSPGEDGAPDRRSPTRRRADALVELVGRALGAGVVPTSGGVRPHLLVTVPWATLLAGGKELAETSWGLPLPRGVLNRLSCDAEVTRILLDPQGVPLDVGRTTRTIPPALRRALAVRDRGCVFPGCDRPPSWCEGHHVIHWPCGGVTALHNLVLLCGTHHRRVHHDGWDIVFDDHQLPQLIPPHRIDPHRRPRRNPYCQRPPDLVSQFT
ncbi:HNH endonuclease signature motif containing protein [Frankia sp. AgKG'84/4]|uniref:HNH endonuclease signature motif containing protein n=1 Tax=Frankia sp. AgKG'84/4 TaxID=573490 RepID=UPI00200CAAAB|nr:HNH endonuclease signature motif containing protein [Frankia sp. AgKG'84/4]